jgi:hypothetical protein
MALSNGLTETGDGITLAGKMIKRSIFKPSAFWILPQLRLRR